MRKDAELHATEDAKRREDVETRNQAENLCYQVEKTLSENAEKIPAETKVPVEKAIADLKEALKGSSITEIQSKQEALNKAMGEITQGMYSQQPPAGDGGAGENSAGNESKAAEGGSQSAGDDTVIDADYTMMDDDKKK